MFIKLNGKKEIIDKSKEKKDGFIKTDLQLNNELILKDPSGNLRVNRYKYTTGQLLIENKISIYPICDKITGNIRDHYVIDLFSEPGYFMNGIHDIGNNLEVRQILFQHRGNELDEYGNSKYKYENGKIVEKQLDIEKYKKDRLNELEKKSFNYSSELIINKFGLNMQTDYEIQRKIDNIITGKSKSVSTEMYNNTVNLFIAAFKEIEILVMKCKDKKSIDAEILKWNPPKDFV